MKNTSQTPSGLRCSIAKFSLLGFITLLLFLPLIWVRGVIEDRADTKRAVEEEVAASYAKEQVIGTPMLVSWVELSPETDSAKAVTNDYKFSPIRLDYQIDVKTDKLHRSIYDVIVYQAEIAVRGDYQISESMLKAYDNTIRLAITDFKGLISLPLLTFGDQAIDFKRVGTEICAQLTLPAGTKVGDVIPFSFTLQLNGSKSLMVRPYGIESTCTMHSNYPDPSFQGDFLPTTREVREDGFDATWKLLRVKLNTYTEAIGVNFVDLANPYQQSMRSAKYGMLIILLVFVAGLFVEFLTRREINLIQYVVIGFSLVLFYSLLLAFSELICFAMAYMIAALMTIGALMLYFRAILAHRVAYLLGGFLVMVYVMNYILLQMETYALLAGSLILFLLLTMVMYVTASINKPQTKEEAAVEA